MSVLHHYHFYALPAAVRNHLRSSIGDADYLVYRQVRSNLAVIFTHSTLVLFCGFLLYLALLSDFGDPLNDLAWLNTNIIVWYGILMFGIVYALYSIWKRVRLHKKFRFTPGLYVLPFSLVDTRSEKIAIYDLSQLRKIHVKHHSSNGNYTRSECKFEFNGGEMKALNIKRFADAEDMSTSLSSLQSKCKRAFEQGDVRATYGFDPFLDLRKRQWRGAEKQSNSWFFRQCAAFIATRLPMLALITVILAPSLWYVRNTLADAQMFERAKQLRTEAAYLGYIKQGRFHVKEMRAGLPRVVFDQVKSTHSVSAFRALKKRFPEEELRADIADEIHRLYQKSWLKFQSQAVNTDDRLVISMEQLLRHAEENDDPVVAINFTRPTASDLSRLDSTLRLREAGKSGMRIALASPHFADDSAAAREARIIEGLRIAFSSIFPNDVLAFQSKRNVDASKPKLDISYQIDPSGMLYYSEKNVDDAFVGLAIRFKAEIVVPQTVDRWKFDLEVRPPQRFQVEFKTSNYDGVDRPSDGLVYSVMAERAFEQLASKIAAAFFKVDSAVFIRQQERIQKLGVQLN